MNLIEKQIMLELEAAHAYRSISYYMNHPQVALRGFYKFFLNEANEELRHAEDFITFYQKRGNVYHPGNIACNVKEITLLGACTLMSGLERKVLENLKELHKSSDLETQVFCEGYILHQIDAIAKLDELSNKIAVMHGNPVGLFMLDASLE